ncbi:MAG: homoserine O-acetyltransferase [Sphingobacteriales bacterium]|nr:homoserine O-acetyltransferase [Sphingobacteriales bacterium]
MLKEFKYNQPFQLESGRTLPGFHLAYTTHGTLNEDKSNVVWIFHALTANSDPAEWWDGLVGEGKLFTPEKYFIICVNMPGSCYGSIGPLDLNEATGEVYYHDFPFFTIRDMIRAYQPLKESLGIHKIHIGAGGSMGGQQLLEWAIEEPHTFEYLLPIATNAQHSPWGIAFNTSQRMAIEADASWKEKKADAGIGGMKVARSIALLSYRHYETYGVSQLETDSNKTEKFKSESYQRYQGEKLAKRFNAFSYHTLSLGMDAHNVGRRRVSVEAALKTIHAKTLVIGISSDLLFPVKEQKFLAANIPNAQYEEIHSFYGHDGFLLEYEAMTEIIENFFRKEKAIITNYKQQTTNEI